jgi:hypothetical protein
LAALAVAAPVVAAVPSVAFVGVPRPETLAELGGPMPESAFWVGACAAELGAAVEFMAPLVATEFPVLIDGGDAASLAPGALLPVGSAHGSVRFSVFEFVAPGVVDRRGFVEVAAVPLAGATPLPLPPMAAPFARAGPVADAATTRAAARKQDAVFMLMLQT